MTVASYKFTVLKEIITERFEPNFDEIHKLINKNTLQNTMSFAEKLDDKIEIKKSLKFFQTNHIYQLNKTGIVLLCL